MQERSTLVVLIGYLVIGLLVGALSVRSALRFRRLLMRANSRNRLPSLMEAIALAFLAISVVLLALGAPEGLAGLFFGAAGAMAVVMLVTLITSGIRPRRIRHAWRNIGDPEAWRGHRDLDL